MNKYKAIAIKLGENLKYGSSINEINRIAKSVFPFNKKEHPNDSITSLRAKEVYDWVLTLSEQDLTETDKDKLLKKFIKELESEFILSQVSEGFEIVNETNKKQSVKNTESKNVFVLMPFDNQSQTIYYNVLKPVIESLGYSVSKADENIRTGTVIEQIQESIRNALLVVADVSGKNPNVFYELGYAHGLEKNVLIITTNKNDIPFDISHIRYFEYSYDPNFENLRNKFLPIFKKNLEEIYNVN
ncbi:MAG: hypothetical protein RXP30_01300 [Thermoplasmata archaeon]|nr:hypothetical protein [Euryarchaeota archaeon]